LFLSTSINIYYSLVDKRLIMKTKIIEISKHSKIN